MPLTPEQLDNWFTYHAPTDETAPKYAAIRAAEEACHVAVSHVFAGRGDPAKGSTKADAFAYVRETFRAFAETIDRNAPDSADKSAAVRCVRLARNAANERIALDLTESNTLQTCAHENLRAARWQANSAIACGGK